ncbi:hypothetical protein PTKIN_Ptkin12aG0015400 [Pterospermum kingtungense]
MAKERLESEMQQLQEKILNQEHHVENCDFDDIPMDHDYLLPYIDLVIVGLPPSVEVVNVEGFTVPKENAIVIPEILSQYPKIASAKVHHSASVNGLMNTLTEVYKMAREEKHT